MKKIKIGLVLGGGGARGLAHIGVLQSLQAYGIPIDIIVGSSIGAMIGAIYAQHPDADFVEKKYREFLASENFSALGGTRFRKGNKYEPEDLLQQLSREIKRRVVINLAAHRKSLLKSDRLKVSVENLIEPGLIEDTAIPFACSAVDITSGQEVVFQSGDIHQAISASAAIPGFLPPVPFNGHQLVDGSVINNFPIDTAREMGADVVIASNVSATFEHEEVNNVVDIIIRANAAASAKINRLSLKNADLVLTPPIGKVNWSDFEQVDFLIEKGKLEAQRSIEDIRRIIKKRSSFIGHWDNWLMNRLQNHLDKRFQTVS